MPKLVDHDAFRRELLEKAFSLFAQTGYGSLSMKELASGLDISPGLLYHYFAGKEEMFLQMVRQFAQTLLMELSTEASGGATLEAKVEVIFDHLEKREQQYHHLHLALNDFIRLIGIDEFRHSPVINELIRAHFESIAHTLQLTREQALVLVTYSAGVLLTGFLLPTRTPLAEHKQILLGLLNGNSLSSPELKEQQRANAKRQ